jgi:hypothetical protein
MKAYVHERAHSYERSHPFFFKSASLVSLPLVVN